MLDQASLRRFEARCTQESPPPCRQYCPFHLDVRAFLKSLSQGKADEARKLYERHVPLPNLMAVLCDAPCEEVCLRRDYGGSLALHKLEAGVLRNTSYREPLFPLPQKRHAMAVVGAGLAGLTAAYDLARKNYPVTVFYEGEISDAFFGRYRSLQREDGEYAQEAFRVELSKLTQRKVRMESCTIDNALLDDLSRNFAAILVDADAARNIAPERDGVDGETLVWRDRTVCAGFLQKSATGHVFALPSRQAGEGRFAAQTMERVAANLSLTAEREKRQGELHVEVGEVPWKARLEKEGLFTEEEAKEEASRCLECDCMQCVRQCAYMQKYKGYPRLYARQIHNNAAIVKGLHTANALINGCTLCRQCEEICPERFSMAELCLAAREEMVENGLMPPSAHEFALEDMESAQSEACFLALRDLEGDGPRYVFFPGCQLSASRGEQVRALYEWLKERIYEREGGSLSLLLACCGQPAHWAGRKRLFDEERKRIYGAWEELGRPVVLTACASCLAAFREGIPEIEAKSVWEALDEFDVESLRSCHGEEPLISLPNRFSMHDPCAARSNDDWLHAVRSLAKKAGVQAVDPPFSQKTTGCCGYGGLVWCAQPETARAITEHLAESLPYPALASCIMCRDRLAASGKEAWHLLDVLMPHLAANSGNARGIGLGERRIRRARLKASFLGETINEEPSKVSIAGHLIPMLEERHILLSDLEEALSVIEEKKLWFLNVENRHRLGSWRPRRVTFWVEYEVRSGGYYVHDAWCHRMIVPGSGGREADEVIKEQQYCTDGGRRERT